MVRLRLASVIIVAIAAPAAANGSLQLTLADGRASLVATEVTVGEILSEWARVGGTRIVNGDRVPGGRVTLQLSDVPEREALDLLLRQAAGYVATQRKVDLEAGSRFELVLILPTSAPPSPQQQRAAAASFTPATAAPVYAPSGALRVIGPDGEPVPDDQEGAPPAPPLYQPLPPGFAEPPDGVPPPAFNPPASATPGSVPVPGMIVPPDPAVPREVQPIVVPPEQ
jgi:hypothetical protein